MQQIVYDYIEKIINHDIIDNCLNNYNKNNNNENFSIHSNTSVTPPQSTKGGSNNSNKDSQKDSKSEYKKIIFSIEGNKNINFINNKEKNNTKKINNNNSNTNKIKFLVKKRNRIFSIQKFERNQKDVNQKIIKKEDILKEKNSLQNNNKDNFDEGNIIINIIKNNDKKNNNFDISNNKNININNNNNINKNINNTNNKEINSKKKKKERSLNEKELQILYEQKFLENINKEYSDKEYEIDMNECLKDKKLKFMKDNFPIMFQKDKYYLYSILPKKRQASKQYFIEPNYFQNLVNENIYNNYDILYNDYELFFKENTNKIITDNYLNILYNNINKNSENINQGFLNENNENISNNNNEIINNYNIPNIIDINENIKNNYKYNKNKNKFIKNKIKIFRIFKSKKLFKNNSFPEINKQIINENNCKINNNNIDLIIKEKFSLIPRKVWSLENNKINIDKFFDDCIQVWPFDECCFIKEISLEFLMKNNYNTQLCLEKLKEFVYFMKKRAKELDFPIINKNIKTIKRYNLRKTNFN